MSIVNTIVKTAKAGSPVIAAVVGIGGIAYATYKIVKKNQKMPIILKNAEQKKGAPLNRKEKTKIYIREYAAPGLIFITAAALEIGTGIHAINMASKATKLEGSLVTSTALCSAYQARLAEVEEQAKKHISPAVDSKIREELSDAHTTGEVYSGEDLRTRLDPRKSFIFIEDKTGIPFPSTVVEVLRTIDIFQDMIHKEGSGSIKELIDLFPNNGVTTYPASAEEYIWIDDERSGEIIANFVLDEGEFLKTGEPVIRIKWTGNTPVNCDVVNGVS